MDNENSVVTLRRLQTFLNKIKTIFIKKGGTADIIDAVLNENVSVSADTDHSVSFTTEAPDSNGSVVLPIPEDNESYTVATCEDYTQSITASLVSAATVAPGCFATAQGVVPDGYADVFYLLPEASAPVGRSVTDPNYGGRILTSKNRSYDVVVINRGTSQVAVEDITITTSSYYQITGTKFRLVFPNITSVTSHTYEYWILLSIPSVASAEDISVTFDNQHIRWASGTPDWSGYIGRTVQIHIIGNVATITAYLFEPIISQASLTSGSYADAVAYASLSANVDRAFQWLLDDYENGVRVTKPIWHLGGGYFVDAEGAVVSGNIEITPSSPSSGHTTPGEIVNPDPVNVD